MLAGAAPLARPASVAGQEPNWSAIRKGPLSATDQGTVPKWIAAEIDQIFTAEDPAKPGLEFYKKITSQVRAPDAAVPFKEAVSQAIAQAFTARYQRAAGSDNRPNPLAPVFVLMTLRQMGPFASALPAFQAVFGDPTPAVRCQGITGLNALRASIPAATRTRLIEPIRKAAIAETTPSILSRFYDFIEYVGDNPAQGQDLQIMQTFVGILDARLSRVEKQGEWPAVADAETINWLAGKVRAPTFNNAQVLKDVVRVAARLLADAAYAQANLKPSEQIELELERIVALTEDPSDADRPVLGLADLYKAKVPNGAVPSPSVTEAVNSTTPDQKARVSTAIAKWIGSDQTKGVLNDPFGLPVGLNIQRPAPTTSTAPAS